jgi:signal peptidase I
MGYNQIIKPDTDKSMKNSLLFEDLAVDILGQGNCIQFRAHGNSMAPLIRNGDVVLVEPVKPEKLRIGDIIFYGTAIGRYIVHRLVRKGKIYCSPVLITRGDNLKHPDAPVSPEHILGKVVRIESQNKELWVNGGIGLVITHLLVCLGSGGYVRNIIRRFLTKLWWWAGKKSSPGHLQNLPIQERH